jgi:hypothetical protein
VIRADLYESTICIESYIEAFDYVSCGCKSRDEFLHRLREGRLDAFGATLPPLRLLPLIWAAKPSAILPAVEVFQLPNPEPAGLFPINLPEKDSPVLISGNSGSTIEVISALLSATRSPFWYCVVDTAGHTVDMAMVYGVMTADRIMEALDREHLDRFAPESGIILPGFAGGIGKKLAGKIPRPVTVGPVCAAALPLFLGEGIWKPVCLRREL